MLLAIVDFASHQFQPARGDAVSLASGRRDCSFALQFAEGDQIEPAENPAVASVEYQFLDLAVLVSCQFNSATLERRASLRTHKGRSNSLIMRIELIRNLFRFRADAGRE